MVPRPTRSPLQQPSQSLIAPAHFLCQCILPPQWLALPGTSSLSTTHNFITHLRLTFSLTVHPALPGVNGMAIAPTAHRPALPRPLLSTLQVPKNGQAGPRLPRHRPTAPPRPLSRPMLPPHTTQPPLLMPPSLVPLTRSLLKLVLVLLPSLVSPLISYKRFHLA